MKTLGIDTSNLVLSVAVVEGNKLLGEYSTNLKKNHSVRLMPTISMLLDELGIEPRELDVISVAHGPGSYTGVRIGLTTAKTLAWSLDVPIVGISSLEVLAGNASVYPGLVCPIMDARRGQVYTALFEHGVRTEEDGIRMIDEWVTVLRRNNQQVLFLGDDVGIHEESIRQGLGNLAHFAPAEWNVPRAAYVARVGMKQVQEGKQQDVDTFVPQYLQLAEAESKWLASQKK